MTRREPEGPRAGTALFGHLGVEWDLRTADRLEREELSRWIALYKRLRPLLASGTVVRGDHADTALWVHGVVAADLSQAVYALVAVATDVQSPPGPVQLPGSPPSGRTAWNRCLPVTWSPVLGTGRCRGGNAGPWSVARCRRSSGCRRRRLHPEQLVLLHVRAVD